MFNFQNDPPKDPRGTSLTLMRTPANRGLTAIILSDDLLGTNTHFYHGRTRPCNNEECDACADGMPWRWHAYFAIWSPSLNRAALFECTAQAAEPFKLYRDAYGTLRGCQFAAKRATTAANSRVIITTRRADLEKIHLPDAPNVIKALSIIWNISIDECQIEGQQKDAPHLAIRQDLGRTKDQVEYSARHRGNGQRQVIPD